MEASPARLPVSCKEMMGLSIAIISKYVKQFVVGLAVLPKVQAQVELWFAKGAVIDQQQGNQTALAIAREPGAILELKITPGAIYILGIFVN